MSYKEHVVKVATITGGILGLVFFVFAIPLCSFVAAMRKGREAHLRRKADAEAIMVSYTKEDWKDFYVKSLPLFQVAEANRSLKPWPSRIQRLNPYDVWVQDDEITMSWTGGFDDDLLYLHVHRKEWANHDDSMAEPAGIEVCCSEKIPERPYVVLSDATVVKPK